MQRWHGQLSAIIAALQAAAGVLPKPAVAAAAAAAAAAAREQGSERGSEASGAARSSYADASHGRGMLQGGTFNSHNILLSTGSFSEDDRDEDWTKLLNVQPGTPKRRAQQRRWVPYTHSNGLAIYQHQGKDSTSASGKGGEEYMVSAVIRGPPGDVLRALLDPGSATTILGPALEVEVLESTPGRQVMRIQVQALGKTAALFRPREAVVQRLLKKEDDGVYVVLFSSVDAYDARAALAHEGVIEEAEGLGSSARLTHPIRCRVSGGYTISKLQGFRGADSPESLLTCILQVNDMGGWLNRSHPLFRAVDWWSGGAYEAFLQRMLLGVTLVRDVVENSRFAVKQPALDFQEHQPEQEQEGEQLQEAGTAPGQAGKALPNLRTSTFVMRQAAASVGVASPFATAAGPPSSAGSSPTASFRPNNSISGSGAGSIPGQRLLMRPSRLASHRLPGSGALSIGLSGSGVQRIGSALAPAAESDLEEPEPEFKLPTKYYQEIHTPGADAPFKLRGPTYLSDGRKVPAGQPLFELLGMEVVDVGGPGPCPHISRYLPSVRRSSKPFLFVYNLMVPGPPTICCVFVFGADSHPNALGSPPDDPEESSSWTPFDFLMYRFLQGDDEERRSMFKMIPRVAEGSWVIKQSVGSTPVIIGRKLGTSFHITQKYVEVAVDVGSSSTAQYITGMVRGGARNLVLDLGLVLEGHHSWELPEELLGAVRVIRLDLSAASKLDDSREVPLRIVSSEQPADSAESAAS
uniref:Protein ENHANCED DISEASE RESISTANCE 2 C-terminal domain-containing protein n=1 Tax=Tetradesmus obliquus TaxID=3088 RepID=A0A383VGR2_TETOB|eukprot:jgi/Sobl393_1/5465/SZX64391.1